jgi:hypothetical protein
VSVAVHSAHGDVWLLQHLTYYISYIIPQHAAQCTVSSSSSVRGRYATRFVYGLNGKTDMMAAV